MLPFIILFILVVSLSSVCTAVTGNPTSTKDNNGGTVLYASTVAPLSINPLSPDDSIMGYYINPSATPISQINFYDLKNAGITDIYVLVNNTNYQPILSEAKIKADAAGIRTHAWVFPGFDYTSQVADMGIGVLLDVETYDMPASIPEIKAMREATQGVTFSLCVKPDGWDGNQYLYLLAPLCDYIVPMLYIGDYNKDINDLTNWVKFYNIYNIIFPGKILAGLETYESDLNQTPKNESTILAEIKAVQPYTGGVVLFRYGLSNFNGSF